MTLDLPTLTRLAKGARDDRHFAQKIHSAYLSDDPSHIREVVLALIERLEKDATIVAAAKDCARLRAELKAAHGIERQIRSESGAHLGPSDSLIEENPASIAWRKTHNKAGANTARLGRELAAAETKLAQITDAAIAIDSANPSPEETQP